MEGPTVFNIPAQHTATARNNTTWGNIGENDERKRQVLQEGKKTLNRRDGQEALLRRI